MAEENIALVDHDYSSKLDSGIDEAFDALMNLRENQDLAEFMTTDDVDLLCKLNPVNSASAVQSVLEDDVVEIASEAMEVQDEVVEIVVDVASKETKNLVENNEATRVASKPLPQNHA